MKYEYMLALTYEAIAPLQMAHAPYHRLYGSCMSRLLPHMVDAPPDDPGRSWRKHYLLDVLQHHEQRLVFFGHRCSFAVCNRGCYDAFRIKTWKDSYISFRHSPAPHWINKLHPYTYFKKQNSLIKCRGIHC